VCDNASLEPSVYVAADNASALVGDAKAAAEAATKRILELLAGAGDANARQPVKALRDRLAAASDATRRHVAQVCVCA
jgi:hypothetical protein